MTLLEQAARRVNLAWEIGQTPVRWVANVDTAAKLPSVDLCGVPIEIGSPRSDWGLDLVLSEPR